MPDSNRLLYLPQNIAIGCQFCLAKIETARYAIGRLPTMRTAPDLSNMTPYTMIESKAMPEQTNGLAANLHFACGSMPDYDYELIERRSVPRIATPFRVMLRGVSQAGDRFTIDTVLGNFSAAGLFLRLARPIDPGATVFVVVRFAVGPAPWLAAPGVAARGVVVWAEPQLGAWGIALKFTRQRFLYAFAV
jgi:hypothetical protein